MREKIEAERLDRVRERKKREIREFGLVKRMESWRRKSCTELW